MFRFMITFVSCFKIDRVNSPRVRDIPKLGVKLDYWPHHFGPLTLGNAFTLRGRLNTSSNFVRVLENELQ
jgi:hypothetical protein